MLNFSQFFIKIPMKKLSPKTANMLQYSRNINRHGSGSKISNWNKIDTYLRGARHCITFSRNRFFLHISKDAYFSNVAWKFHRETPEIGSVTADRGSRLGSKVIRNQNFECVYLETTFLNLVDRLDRLVRLVCSRSHFVQNFCRYGTT